MGLNSIRAKLVLAFTLVLLIIFIVITGATIYSNIVDGNREITELKTRMLETSKLRLGEEVDIALSLIENIRSEGIKKGIDEEILKIQAKDAVRSLRYGKEGYFWIDNSEYILQVLPPTPEKEGMNRAELKDVNNKYFVKELVDGAVKDGETYVEYLFRKLGDENTYPKLGHTKYYKEWKWVVGTGIYIDDIDKKVNEEKVKIGNRIKNSIVMSLIFFVVLYFAAIIVIYVISSKITGQISVLLEKFEQGAEGDLTVQVNVTGKDEIAKLSEAFNRFIQNIKSMVKEIESSSYTVASSSNELSAQMRSIADGAVEQIEKKAVLDENFITMSQSMNEIMDNIKNQVAGLEEVSSSMAEIAQTSNHVAKNAEITMKMSANAVNEAKIGGESVKKTLEGISRIEELVKNTEEKVKKLSVSSDEIGDIVKTIDEIAGQTNLLALNAAIEAAHAGESGKGFAVVADEIKELAERSQDATKQIEKLIVGIQKEVNLVIEATKDSYEEVRKSNYLSMDAEKNLFNIIENIEKTNMEVGNISKAMEEQATAVDEISSVIHNVAEGSSNIEFKAVDQIEILKKAEKALRDISDIIETTTAATEESASVSMELANLADSLDKLIKTFVLEEKEK